VSKHSIASPLLVPALLALSPRFCVARPDGAATRIGSHDARWGARAFALGLRRVMMVLCPSIASATAGLNAASVGA
jgi:hypothetical protein